MYVGGGIGGFYTDVKQDGGASGNIPTLFENFTLLATAPPHLTEKNFATTLFCGYGWQWRRLFIGGEIFGNASVHQTMKSKAFTMFLNMDDLNENSFTIDSKARIDPLEAGVICAPGVLLSPATLLYGRVGTSVAKIHAETSTDFQGNLQLLPRIGISRLSSPSTKQKQTFVLELV